MWGIALMAFFAVAMSVGALGAAWLTISGYKTGVARMDSFSAHLAKIEDTMSKTSATAIRAEVDALAGAVDAVRLANRKELGRLWARVGGDRSRDDHAPPPATDDERFEAMLALQRADPAKPQ